VRDEGGGGESGNRLALGHVKEGQLKKKKNLKVIYSGIYNSLRGEVGQQEIIRGRSKSHELWGPGISWRHHAGCPQNHIKGGIGHFVSKDRVTYRQIETDKRKEF